MKATIQVEVQPFTVPLEASVLIPGDREAEGTVPLSTLEPSVLERLCDDFRAGVFECAKKQQPPHVAASMTESEIQSIFKQAVREVIQIITIDMQDQAPSSMTRKYGENLIRALRIKYNVPNS